MSNLGEPLYCCKYCLDVSFHNRKLCRDWKVYNLKKDIEECEEYLLSLKALVAKIEQEIIDEQFFNIQENDVET